jgi:hypothetical protein
LVAVAAAAVAASAAIVVLAVVFEADSMKQLTVTCLCCTVLCGAAIGSLFVAANRVCASPVVVSGAPRTPAAAGKKWAQRTLKGATTGQWIQVVDKSSVPRTGPASSALRGSEIVGDHWHWPDDYLTVLHGERWGRAGRLGTCKVKVRKVP